MESSPLWGHRLTSQGGVATIALSGELDLASASNVQALLFELVQAADTTEVRVDLAKVGFLDSSALGVLISGLNLARQQGRGFAVINASPAAQRILTVTGLDEILTQP